MSSVVFICNLALTNLAKPDIEDINEDSSEARACKQYYEHVRDMLLQAAPWRFAAKTVSLAEVTNDKPGDWLHAYQRPTDCLKVRYIRPEYSETPSTDTPPPGEYGYPYELEGQKLYCDLSPALLRYTYRLTDPTKYSPTFIEAFGWHLAVRLAMPLTRDPKVRADAYNVAVRMQASAEALDANEERHDSNHDSELVAGRA